MSGIPNLNFAELKKQIANNQTKKVLSTLENKLRNSKFQDYYHEVILISNNYKRLESANRIDILHFQDYTKKTNQINKSVLDLMEDLQAGRQLKKVKEVEVFPFWKIATFLAIAVFVVLGAIGGGVYYLIDQNNKDDDTTLAQDWNCPDFGTHQTFKILVLPFHDVMPAGASIAPHKAITDRLANFCKQKNLGAEVRKLINDEDIKSFATADGALDFTLECQKDMIVWGTATGFQEGLALTTNFSLVEPFKFQQISDSETSGTVETLLPEFHFNSHYEEAIETIENILTILLSYKSNRHAEVIEANKNLMEIKDTSSNVFLNYMVASSHQMLSQNQEAIAAYSTILNLYPTASLALNNRAFLNLKQNKPDEALVDFNTLIVLNKADKNVYLKRSELNENKEEFSTAKSDLIKAKELSKDNDEKIRIDKKIRRIDLKIENEVRQYDLIQPTDNQTLSPENISNNLTADSRRNNRLGNYSLAERNSIDALRIQPSDPSAQKELIKALYHQNPKITLQDLQKVSELKSLDLAALKAFNEPVFNTIIQNGKVVGFQNTATYRNLDKKRFNINQ